MVFLRAGSSLLKGMKRDSSPTGSEIPRAYPALSETNNAFLKADTLKIIVQTLHTKEISMYLYCQQYGNREKTY